MIPSGWSETINKLSVATALTVTTALMVALLANAPAAGTAAASPEPIPATSGPAPMIPATALTAEDAATWLDGLMPYALRRGGIPGAVVVIVKSGSVLLEKGYGVADIGSDKPVDPTRTLFRPGSVSKLFMATAVMQLVERGRLNLDTDVNRYLDFEIPPRNGQPITLRNLLTHTAGFEDAIRGIAAKDPEHIPSLAESLKRWTPARVLDPGTTPAYSNYGAALAGYIVERVSGEPFNDYVKHHIFVPLGMDHSTFDQPLPPALRPDMSNGYMSAGSVPVPFELVAWRPAGALTSDGDDMARFMIAHLQEGRFGNTQMLEPGTARAMHSTALTFLPGLNRMDLGFSEENLNGHRIIGHAGDTVLFHSQLWLYLDDGVGLFVALNSPGKAGASFALRRQLFEGFTDRYFPDPEPRAAQTDTRNDLKSALAHGKLFVGNYVSSRSSRSSFMSALSLLSQIEINTHPDGSISCDKLLDSSGDVKRYREIAPFVWQEIGGHDRLAALLKDGRIVRVSFDPVSAFTVWDSVPAWKSLAVLKPACLAALLTVLLTIVAWPVVAVIRWKYCVRYSLEGRPARVQRLARIFCVIALAAIAGWLWLLSLIASPLEYHFLGDREGQIHLIQILTLVGFIGGLGAAAYEMLTVWKSASRWFGKIWSVLLTLAMLALVWTGFAYHLLSLNTRF